MYTAVLFFCYCCFFSNAMVVLNDFFFIIYFYMVVWIWWYLPFCVKKMNFCIDSIPAWGIYQHFFFFFFLDFCLICFLFKIRYFLDCVRNTHYMCLHMYWQLMRGLTKYKVNSSFVFRVFWQGFGWNKNFLCVFWERNTFESGNLGFIV